MGGGAGWEGRGKGSGIRLAAGWEGGGKRLAWEGKWGGKRVSGREILGRLTDGLPWEIKCEGFETEWSSYAA